MIPYSEQFDNAVWNKRDSSTVTANAAVAPNGTTTADKLVPSTGSSDKYVYQNMTVVNGSTYTESVYVKAAGYNYAYLKVQPSNTTACYGVVVDLTNGSMATVVSTGGATGSYQIVPVGNGWYRIGVTATAGATTWQWTLSPSPVASPVLNGFGDNTFVGDGTSGIYAWGAQLELGAWMSSYVATLASAAVRDADLLRIPSTWIDDGPRTIRTRFRADKAATGSSQVVWGRGGAGAGFLYINGSWYHNDGTNSPNGVVAFNGIPMNVCSSWAGSTQKFSVNGGAVVSSAYDGSMGTGSFYGIGNDGTGTYTLSGGIEMIETVNMLASDAQTPRFSVWLES